jgi:hypothetical protein
MGRNLSHTDRAKPRRHTGSLAGLGASNRQRIFQAYFEITDGTDKITELTKYLARKVGAVPLRTQTGAYRVTVLTPRETHAQLTQTGNVSTLRDNFTQETWRTKSPDTGLRIGRFHRVSHLDPHCADQMIFAEIVGDNTPNRARRIGRTLLEVGDDPPRDAKSLLAIKSAGLLLATYSPSIKLPSMNEYIEEGLQQYPIGDFAVGPLLIAEAGK